VLADDDGSRLSSEGTSALPSEASSINVFLTEPAKVNQLPNPSCFQVLVILFANCGMETKLVRMAMNLAEQC
jgi:hypothetical protein